MKIRKNFTLSKEVCDLLEKLAKETKLKMSVIVEEGVKIYERTIRG